MPKKITTAAQKTAKPSRPLTRFDLRDVHQEIDLCDRKIAHLEKFETFDSEQAKQRALDTLTTKRNKLVTAASGMIADGITFEASDLPRSMRSTPEVSQEKPKYEQPTVIRTQPQSSFGASIANAEAEQRAASRE